MAIPPEIEAEIIATSRLDTVEKVDHELRYTKGILTVLQKKVASLKQKREELESNIKS